MKTEERSEIFFMVVIAGRNLKDDLLKSLSDAEINLVNIGYGRGTVDADYLSKVFGLFPENNKVVIFCVSTRAKIDSALKVLIEKFNFDKPNTGIAATVRVNGISY